MSASPAITLEGIEARFDHIDERFIHIDQKFAHIDDKFDHIDQKFAHIDEKFDNIDQKFVKVDQKFDEVMGAIDTLGKSIDSMGKSTHKAIYALQEAHMQHFQITQDIQRRVVVLEDSVGDVQESLDFLTLAEEKDAEATINHELRIARLEKTSGIEGITPTHLSDFE